MFDAVVPPGEAVDLTAALPPLPPGRYHVQLDMIDEQHAWFYQTGGHGTSDAGTGGAVKKQWRLLGSVVLVAVLAWRIDWAQAGAALARANWALWAAGLGVYLFAQAVSAVRWRMLSRVQGFGGSPRPLPRLLLHRHVFQPALAHVDRRRHGAHVVSGHARGLGPAAGEAAGGRLPERHRRPHQRPVRADRRGVPRRPVLSDAAAAVDLRWIVAGLGRRDAGRRCWPLPLASRLPSLPGRAARGVAKCAARVPRTLRGRCWSPRCCRSWCKVANVGAGLA